MDENMKKRLVGATVLVSLVVIFVPMLLEDEPVVIQNITETNIPPEPKAGFTPHIELEKTRVPLVVAESKIEAVSPVEVSSQKQKPTQPNAKPMLKARVGLSAWVVQVASFGQQINANNLVKRLQAMKFSAFQEQASVEGKTIFRVRVGPVVDHKKATDIQNRIEKRIKLKGKIERYP